MPWPTIVTHAIDRTVRRTVRRIVKRIVRRARRAWVRLCERRVKHHLDRVDDHLRLSVLWNRRAARAALPDTTATPEPGARRGGRCSQRLPPAG